MERICSQMQFGKEKEVHESMAIKGKNISICSASVRDCGEILPERDDISGTGGVGFICQLIS